MPDHRQPGERPDITAVLRGVASAGVAQLVDRAPGVRADRDPEDLHQARVATRRLRADLRSLEPVLDVGWTTRIRGELRWLGGLLGQVRDLDVLQVHLSEQLSDATLADQLLGEGILAIMSDQRALRHRELTLAMSSDRYLALIEDLHDAAERPPLAPGVDALRSGRKLLRRATATAWHRTDTAVQRLGEHATLAELHEVRKRTKRARYAAQLSAPVFGAPARRLAARLGAVQDHLGDINDAVTLAAWLDREAPRGFDPPAAFLAGRIAERQRSFIELHRVAWLDTWSAIRPGDLRWLQLH